MIDYYEEMSNFRKAYTERDGEDKQVAEVLQPFTAVWLSNCYTEHLI